MSDRLSPGGMLVLQKVQAAIDEVDRKLLTHHDLAALSGLLHGYATELGTQAADGALKQQRAWMRGQ